MHLLTAAFGPSRQAAFFRPTVANGALRTLLDLQLCPAQSLMTDAVEKGKNEPTEIFACALAETGFV